jgi:hypothetical protein
MLAPDVHADLIVTASSLAYARCGYEPTGGIWRKSTVCTLNGLRPGYACIFKSSTRLGNLAALALGASFRGPLCSRFAFGRKNMAQHIFSFESELQNISPEPAPSSRSLSPTVSEKLARYGSSALSGLEHLTLIVASLPL